MSYVEGGLVLWPLSPNWKKTVKETLEYRTRIIGPTYTGLRQKRRMRIAPRRSFAFEVHPYDKSKRLLDNLRFSHGAREWAMPVFHDRQRLASTLAEGETTIPCATVDYDFADGRYAVLCNHNRFITKFEIVQLTTVGSGVLNLAAPTEEEWPAGSFLYPIRMARLDFNSNNASILNGKVSTLSVVMDVTEPCDWPEHEFADEYRGRPVWEFGNNWRSGRSFGFNRIIETVDNDTSMPVHFDFPNKTFAALDTEWQVHGRAAQSVQRSALYALLGRYTSVWVPTLTEDLKPLLTIGSASTTVTVEYCGYTLFGLGQEGRQDIRIELYDGTVYYRRITGSNEVLGVEQLTINTALGAEVTIAQIRRISFMMLMQQASDSITITNHAGGDGAATAPVVFEGVVEPP